MRRIIALFVVVVVIIVAFGGWWITSLSPANSQDFKARRFVIAKGDGVREVAKKLHEERLIRDQVAFFLLVKKLEIEKNIQAGSYELSPSQSAEEIANKLTLGTEDIWITIPEGWRNAQVIEYLFRVNTEWEKDVPTDDGWTADEGRLFPDTYLVPKEVSLSQLKKMMMENFDKKVDFPVSNEQLIIASMVEREAKHDVDRPLVAGVIYNRMKSNMALNVDATLQYAIGFTQQDGWWKRELTQEDKKFISPYNTYLHAGLPPTPICNPGLSSIKASVNPASTDYYYYISDKMGVNHYARTLEEHNGNVQKYLR